MMGYHITIIKIPDEIMDTKQKHIELILNDLNQDLGKISEDIKILDGSEVKKVILKKRQSAGNMIAVFYPIGKQEIGVAKEGGFCVDTLEGIEVVE